MKRKRRKKINLLPNLISVMILSLFLGILLLRLTGICPYIVMSGSMEPVLHTGSLCFVDTKTEYQQVQEGDIIAFQAESGVMVTHRAVKKTDYEIRTKGDNNDTMDIPVVTEKNFKGKTIASVPYVGYFVWWISTVRGKIILITVCVSVYLICTVRKRMPSGKSLPGTGG